MTLPLLLMLLAAAPPATDSAQKATFKPRLSPFLPTLRLSSGTDKDSKLQASFDAVSRPRPDWDLGFTPTLEVSTPEGLGTLLSFKEGTASGGASWAAGLSLSAMSVPKSEPSDDEEMSGIKHKAYSACTLQCAAKDASDADKKFCEEFKMTAPENIDIDEFCKKGLELLKTVEHDKIVEHESRALYSPLMISVGGMIGGASFEYLENNEDQRLEETTRTQVHPIAAGSVTHVARDSGFTFELPLVYTAKWEASKATAKWCRPSGQVEPEPPAVDPVDSMTCQEATLGSPTRSWKFFTTAQFGYVDIKSPGADLGPRSFYRYSVGPTFSYSSSAEEKIVSLGLQTPIYVNFASAPAYVGSYKGLLRVVPSFVFAKSSKEDAKWDPQLLITLEVLADRSMFPRALEWR
ncbi:hypothetical protein [Archangium sp.]|uniref:hypothetical protein n=1 Tax=Archangium sp. TaxID=1872627 RepID=UPI002D4EEEF7|nr:hypothetical protein [Archangium sp.]HYO54896.1 hypothetical protein [Archangium sp.]